MTTQEGSANTFTDAYPSIPSYRGQTTTATECTIADSHYRLRNRHRGQTTTATERTIADTCYRLRNRHRGQTTTTKKSRTTDSRY